MLSGLFLATLRRKATGLSPSAKAVIAACCDFFVLLAVSLSLTGFDTRTYPALTNYTLAYLALAAPIFGVVSLSLAGSYAAVLRYIELAYIGRCGAALVFAAAAMGASGALFGLQTFHPGLLLPLASTGFLAIVFLRIVVRKALLPANLGTRERIVIYGAGADGIQLAGALALNRRQWHIVGFVDDDPSIRHRTILGVRVYSAASLPQLREEVGFSRIVVAMPADADARRRRVLESLAQLAVRVSVMPSLGELTSGRKHISDLRDVQPEDLLARNPVEPSPALLAALVKSRAVLVTGGGGSIGSELCRQAVKIGARRLVVLDQSEYALYKIDQELKLLSEGSGLELVPVLGDVTDRALMESLIRRYDIQTIYHAAAYKHVAMAEVNPVVTVRNNVLGTLSTLEAAIAAGVSNFVLISTDKAVNPTSIMGSSKRVCEMMVRSISQRIDGTRMSVVRFGNVLASSGSVVPLFIEQIAKGGPVTVTHPDVSRYFMTIPEAAQLVIQAAALGQQGDVLMLDMGEPVRILDLAKRLIHLAGCSCAGPGNREGIEIRISGLGSGEKLHETLTSGGDSHPTHHPKIFVVEEPVLRHEQLWPELDDLRTAIEGNCPMRVRNALRKIVGTQLEGSAIPIPRHAPPDRDRVSESLGV
jgi:FlaA1/EpsC-like NDP-sugar epimerase